MPASPFRECTSRKIAFTSGLRGGPDPSPSSSERRASASTSKISSASARKSRSSLSRSPRPPSGIAGRPPPSPRVAPARPRQGGDAALQEDVLERHPRLAQEDLQGLEVPDRTTGPRVVTVEDAEDVPAAEERQEHRLGRRGIAEPLEQWSVRARRRNRPDVPQAILHGLL